MARRLEAIFLRGLRRLPVPSVNLRLAVTAEELRAGLNDVAALGDNEGMLFVFSERAAWPFTSSRVLYPLDLAWLDDAGRIVDMTWMMPGSATTYAPRTDARYAVELPSNWFQRHDVRIGDRLFIPK